MGLCASRRSPSLAEFYELDSPEVVLGEGTCSRVFRARERATGGLVAIKRLDKAQQRLIDDDPVQWEREVVLLRRCASHPNVVAFHDVLETPNFVYIIMELAEGGELFQALIDEGAYSEWDARRYIADLLEALRFLHGLGIVHRYAARTRGRQQNLSLIWLDRLMQRRQTRKFAPNVREF